MERRDEIIRLIRRNRISTTEVADALGKTGVLVGVQPITPDRHRTGPVRALFTAHASNHALHDQLPELREGEIAVVFAHACEGRALLGDLMSKYILLYRGAEALIVDGAVRDAARLKREGYPIWASGVTPLGCFNEPADPFPPKREAELRERFDGGVAVCDDGGVVVIPKTRLNGETVDRLQRIELQEDVWYYCLDTLKWDTRKIVCDKAYLTEPDALPTVFRDRLARLSMPFDDSGNDEGKG
jgi:regulator of RNase E activity RraA